MAKQIKKSEIYESDLFVPLIKQGEQMLKILNANTKALQEFAKQQAKIASKADTNSAKGIRDLEKATRELKATQQEKAKLDEQARQLRVKLNVANSEAVQKNVELKVQLQEQNKINKQIAREKLKLVGAYAKESKKLNDLRKRYKDLAVQNKENTKEGRALLKNITELDRKLKNVDASVGQFQRNVGNYTSAFKGLGNVWKNLTNVATQFGLALGGFAVARDAFNVIKDFDQAQANLAAITGKSRDEIASLTKQAKELGSTTSFTASEVAGLQTELAKLGFNTTEIEQSTESILQFAKATGADLSEAAALSGSALRAFGLDASEAARVNSVLGVATTKTALDFSKLNNSLSTVAPVANAFGFSIEETTALLGQLSNAGFDASSSATATRNILLNLADSNGKLAKELGRPITSAADLAKGLQELNDKGIDLASALELTDKRSVAAFQTFLQGANDLQPLVESLTDVEDELTAIAKTQDDTLQGALDRLRSAWEGYILGADGAAGASSRLKDIIDFLAENLDVILDTILRLGRAFVIFRTTLFLTNKVIMPMISTIKVLSAGFGKMGGGLKGATTAFKGLNSAMKANIIGLVTIAVIELADALDVFTSQAEKTQAAIDKSVAQAEKTRAGTLGNVNKLISENNKAREKQLKLIKDELDLNIAGVTNETKRQKLIDEATKKSIGFLQVSIKANAKTIKDYEKRLELTRKEFEIVAERAELRPDAKWDDENIQAARARLAEEVKTFEEAINLLKNDEIALNEKIAEFERDSIIRAKESISKSKTKAKNKITEIDIEKERLKLAIREEQSDVKKVQLNKQLKDLEADRYFLKLLSEKRSEEEKKAIKELYETTLRLNEAERRREDFEIYQERIDKIYEEKKSLDELKKAYEDLRLEFLTADSDKAVELVDREINALTTKVKSEQDLAALQEKELERQGLLIDQVNRLREAEVKAANDKYDAEFKLLELRRITLELKKASNKATEEDLQELEVLNAKIEQLEKNRNAEVANINKRAANEIETIENQSYERRKKNQEDFNKKQLEEYQKLVDSIASLFETIADVIGKALDKQIEKQEKFISASQERQDFLKQQAAEGNQVAQDSLAAEEAAEAKALAKKQQAERRKRQLESASIILENIANLVGQGKSIGEATSISIASFETVKALLSNLPAFLDGTEDTGKNGKGIDGKGGFMSILHPNERVMTKEQNAMTNGMSNWELAELAQKYTNGTLTADIQKNSIIDHYSNKRLIQELKGVKKAINEKPVTNIELGKILPAFIEVVERTQKGRTTTTKTHRVR